MPKQTFFNLPDEKREHILAIAIEEFGENDYANVSISHIVERAGIAKGSFYQYFAGKEDLHGYLLDLLAEKKIEMLSIEHPDPQHMGIFAYLRWLVEAGVAFELAYPQLFRVSYRLLNDTSLDEIAARYRQETVAFYQRLVALGKAQGDIDPAVDEEMAAFFFDIVLSNLSQHILERVKRVRGTGWQGKQPFMELPEVRMMFDQGVAFMEHGLGVRKQRPDVNGRRQAVDRQPDVEA